MKIIKKSDVNITDIIQSIKDEIEKSKTDPNYRNKNKMIIIDSLGALNDE